MPPLRNLAFGPASRRDKLILFSLFVLLTWFRMPEITIHGRFWAEEARRFYVDAARHPWYRSLFLPFGGYLNFGATLPAIVARHLVPLLYAPRVTFVFSLLAQISPAVVLLRAKDSWLRPRLALVAGLFLLVAAPAAEEVWLNTLHSQFQLALAVGLMLALEPLAGFFPKLILFLAPLYGLVAIVLLPLFALRALLERSRARLAQAVVLAAGSAIQLLLFFKIVGGRQVLDVKLILATFLAKDIVLPFASFRGEQPVATWLHGALNQGVLPPGAVVGILAALALIALLLWGAPRAAAWLAGASVGLAVFSYYGALFASNDMVEPHLFNRYAFVPEVLMAWALLAVAFAGCGWRRPLAGVLVLWMSAASLDAYLHPAAGFATGPNWHAEVKRWRHNPHYSPLTWPASNGFWCVPMPLPPA